MAGDSGAFGPLIDALPAVAFECDTSGNALALSARWTELTGQCLADALGRGWLGHFDGDGLVVSMASFAQALQRREPVSFVVRVRDASAQWRWLRTSVRANRKPDGSTTIAGLGTPMESSEVDEGDRVRVLELEKIAARAEALLSASPDLLLHLGPDGRFLGFRAPDMAQLYRSPDEFLGKHISEVLPPAIAEQTLSAMRAARTSNIHQHFDYALELGGEKRSFEARVVPMKSGDALAVIRDVTDSRVAEAELVSAREEALERSRLKTQFLANVSHEIRTPLNGILGVTQLLKQHPLPGEFSEYVDVLQAAGESLLAIVNDVLDLSKIEANRLELESRVFDFEQILTETIRSFYAVVQRKGIELTLEVAPEARGPVRGDASRIRQIINNLVGNAVKFTDRGSVRVKVTRQGDQIYMRVVDTGPGIAPEHQGRIFEAFEQENSSIQRRFGGTGLGLAITRRVARLMGGEVNVQSEVGRGSTFLLDVPLPTVVIAHVTNVPARPKTTTTALRVLLAEDDPVNASMTSALLRRLGHKVTVVGDGQAAVSAAAQPDIDLVLMDVHMPVLDGLEATRAIRDAEKGTRRHVPIVALTANAMKGDDLRCLSAGMDAYLPKPVTVTALKDLLIWFGSAGS
ncbi:MAG: hybrid sensor histidine kinase/response regulator [Archangium gephyra]|uniref:Sensory/regulatory protein RpfC n=1 Tax=Archangium gephyra TaxID=48 RepID=A0A2W5TCL7_9BACT|nr:MAG: hybrid sensor histidine kinase/response regulator [Archangium gephyra]